VIDPENVTNYELDRAGLEDNVIFWCLVAGKTADVIAVAWTKILIELRIKSEAVGTPFEILRAFRSKKLQLRALLKRNGIGCHGAKARSLYELADSGFDLATCSLADLTSVHGIGLKTASCFILHTRRNADIAGLDTHMLAELRSLGHDAPKTTPSSLKTYLKWSAVVLDLARAANMTPPQFDLHVFNKRHRKTVARKAISDHTAGERARGATHNAASTATSD
jgi:hypothetical protein